MAADLMRGRAQQSGSGGQGSLEGTGACGSGSGMEQRAHLGPCTAPALGTRGRQSPLKKQQQKDRNVNVYIKGI